MYSCLTMIRPDSKWDCYVIENFSHCYRWWSVIFKAYLTRLSRFATDVKKYTSSQKSTYLIDFIVRWDAKFISEDLEQFTYTKNLSISFYRSIFLRALKQPCSIRIFGTRHMLGKL
jgi:hypothetical protein